MEQVPNLNAGNTEHPKRSRREILKDYNYSKDTGRALAQSLYEEEFWDVESQQKPIQGDYLPGKKIIGVESARQQKAQELQSFYIEVKNAVSKLQAILLDKMRNDPNFWDDPYQALREAYPKEVKIDKETTKILNVIEECLRLHDAVETAFLDFPNPADLYKHTFAREPKGRIEVEKGPMSLYFRCFDASDYAWIYNQSFFHKQETEPTEDQISEADESGGCALASAVPKDLSGAIIAQRVRDSSESASIRNHEEEHVIRRIIKKEWYPEKDLGYNPELKKKISEHLSSTIALPYETRFLDSLTPDLAKAHVEQLMHERNFSHYARGADEILAYFKDGMHTADDTYYFLTQPASDGGLYDYFQIDIEELQEVITTDTKTKAMIKGVVNEAREKYHILLRQALQALLSLYGTGRYSRDEVIAFFDKEPLVRWSKVAERII